MEVTIDTHALVWYLDSSLNDRLSALALQTIEDAETVGRIHLSVIVLAEILHLSQKGRINLDYSAFYRQIADSDPYVIESLTPEVLTIAVGLKGLELHDRIILATAIHTQSALISKDIELQNYPANVIW
ncbi:MAG: type II toxin-antitoxin system VapC family toxin [Leptospiraceae bacterium]